MEVSKSEGDYSEQENEYLDIIMKSSMASSKEKNKGSAEKGQYRINLSADLIQISILSRFYFQIMAKYLETSIKLIVQSEILRQKYGNQAE